MSSGIQTFSGTAIYKYKPVGEDWKSNPSHPGMYREVDGGLEYWYPGDHNRMDHSWSKVQPKKNQPMGYTCPNPGSREQYLDALRAIKMELTQREKLDEVMPKGLRGNEFSFEEDAKLRSPSEVGLLNALTLWHFGSSEFCRFPGRYRTKQGMSIVEGPRDWKTYSGQHEYLLSHEILTHLAHAKKGEMKSWRTVFIAPSEMIQSLSTKKSVDVEPFAHWFPLDTEESLNQIGYLLSRSMSLWIARTRGRESAILWGGVRYSEDPSRFGLSDVMKEFVNVGLCGVVMDVNTRRGSSWGPLLENKRHILGGTFRVNAVDEWYDREEIPLEKTKMKGFDEVPTYYLDVELIGEIDD